MSMKGELHLFMGCMFSGKSLRLQIELTKLADLGLKCLFVASLKDNRREKLALPKLLSVAGEASEVCEASIASVASETKIPTMHQIASTCHSSMFSEISHKIDVVRVSKLSEVKIDTYDVVGVEECHFFEDLEGVMREWVMKYKKRYYAAGLDGTSELTDIHGITRLIPFATSYEQCRANCELCFREDGILTSASFSCRLSKKVDSGLDVGGKEKYIPVCYKHHVIIE